MTSSSNRGLKGLLADPRIRQALSKSAGGEAMFEHLSALSERNVKGYETKEEATAEPSWGNLELALRHSFTTSEIGAVGADRAWILDQSRVVVVNTRRRFSLAPSARADCIDAADARLRAELLDRHREADTDALRAAPGAEDADILVAAHMRALMRGVEFDLRDMTSQARRALVEARRALRLVKTLPGNAPSLEECERQAALADLLDPLGLMIGLGNPLQGSGRSDRFVGRDALLRALRRVVDVLDSETMLEATSRTVYRVGRGLKTLVGTDRPPMLLLTADGGMGKSTLIAKFILDHALGPDRFPFAILDFDRAALQPRNTAALLSEIARQIGLQYPIVDAAVAILRHRLDRLHLTGGVVDVKTTCEALWNIIETARGSSGPRRMLLTLDTLEIVEPDTLALDGVAQVVAALARAAGPDLCVVAAGRSGTSVLGEALSELFELEFHDLPPFSVAEARQMVARLGRDLMGAAWDPDWVSRLAGHADDPPIRREPLSLRIAVELVRDETEENRATLVEKVEADGALGGDGFIGRLYRRRILGHIRDQRAHALAWPGLVARQVTPALAREVLAPLCDLSPDDAETAFYKLAAEGWIVEQVDDTLVHRRDLRARTLPLMRANDAALFTRVAEALAQHYETAETADPIEARYYRMLCDDGHAATLTPEQLSDLAGARGDFPAGSDTRAVIDAAVVPRPVSAPALSRLPPAHAYAHLARVGAGLRRLDDTRLDDRVLTLARMERPDQAAPTEQVSAWQHLKIKTGEWDEVDPYSLALPATDEDLTLFGFHAATLTRAGVVPPQFWSETYPETIERLTSDRVRKNWRALAMALEIARAYDPELADHIDETLRRNPPREGHWARSAEIGLRTLLRCGSACYDVVFPRWCQFEAHRIEAGGMSRRELRHIAEVLPQSGTLDQALRGASRFWPSANSDLIDDNAAVAHVANCLRDWSGDAALWPDPGWVRQYLSVRAPEWVVPLAYVAVLQGEGRRNVGQDMIGYLDAADRAGNLADTVHELTRDTGVDGLAFPRIARKLMREALASHDAPETPR